MLSTWTELKASIANYLNRDDMGSEIEEAIGLAEKSFQRSVTAPEREIMAEVTLTPADETLVLPSDFWAMKSLTLNTDPIVVVEEMSLSELRNSYPTAISGKPQNFAIFGETLILGPKPDDDYNLRMIYVQSIPALGSDRATNWLLTDHPDLYLHAALAQVYILLRDERGVALHASKAASLISEINQSSIQRLRGGTPRRIRSPQVI